jgi:hypothetical protein
VGVVASLCGPAATHQRTEKSAGGLSSEELSRTVHFRAQCGPLYHRVSSFVSLPLCLNFKHFRICVLWCNIRIHIITHISGHICGVFCVNASVLATRKDPG